MQLKRDTDFAIRILFCIKQNWEQYGSEERGGLTLTEMAAKTGVPAITAGRICGYLKAAGILLLRHRKKRREKIYYATEDLFNYSLLDVVEAVEGTGQLFAVFDKSTAAYKNCSRYLLKIQEKSEALLSEATLAQLLAEPNDPAFS